MVFVNFTLTYTNIIFFMLNFQKKITHYVKKDKMVIIVLVISIFQFVRLPGDNINDKISVQYERGDGLL